MLKTAHLAIIHNIIGEGSLGCYEVRYKSLCHIIRPWRGVYYCRAAEDLHIGHSFWDFTQKISFGRFAHRGRWLSQLMV